MKSTWGQRPRVPKKQSLDVESEAKKEPRMRKESQVSENWMVVENEQALVYRLDDQDRVLLASRGEAGEHDPNKAGRAPQEENRYSTQGSRARFTTRLLPACTMLASRCLRRSGH